jgi:lipoate-protein ligase A
MAATGAGKKVVKRKTVGKNLDVNQAAETFIRAFQQAISDPASSINEDRLRFIAKLVEEYFQNKR